MSKTRLITLIIVVFLLFLPVLLSAATFKLPDTGQTKCYQAVEPWAEIPCEGTGQDGAYSINPMNFTDNGNGTVADNNTGLMWQKEDDDNVYNWYEASGTYDETYNPDSQDVCGSLNLGSHSDWRLPMKKELMSIVDYGLPYLEPAIDATYFPNTKTNLSYYWSSPKAAFGPDNVWGVKFASGVVWYVYKEGYNYVRCVRGGQYPDRSFVDNDDGTVTDNSTGLMWQQGEGEFMIWSSALSYCEGLSLGGHLDWRLPNVKELDSLTDDERYYPAIDTNFFPNTYSSDCWSSTKYAGSPNNAWVVDFGGGLVSIDGNYAGNYVRCVRGGQSGPPPPPAYGNLEVSPSSYDFGEVLVGQSPIYEGFILKNTGDTEILLSTIYLSDSTDLSLDTTGVIYPCSINNQILQPGDLCMILVKYSPSQTGTINSALVIESNDPDTPTFNVPIIGSAKKLCNPPEIVYVNNDKAYGLFEGASEIKEKGDTTTVDVDIQGTDIFPLIGGTIHFWATIDAILGYN